METSDTQSSTSPHMPPGYLLFTTLLCGCLVMVIEVLGSRVMGPVFGVSLFVWTSLITVTMVALAIGYRLGGGLVDRYQSPRVLYLLILAAGVCSLVIPWMKEPVLNASIPLGLRLGALTAATVLFGPALLLLGCVSPFVVRLAATSMTHLGRTVGDLYALSTLGSVLGTVLTGFFLLEWASIDRIFQIVGVLLMGCSAGYFLLQRRMGSGLALMLLAAFSTLFLPSSRRTVTLADGTQASVIEHMESYYGRLQVVDYRFGNRAVREMEIDGLIQGGMDLNNRLPVYEYHYLLQHLPRSLYPAGNRVLMIGLGAGLVPSWYVKQGLSVDAVDIDPHVVTFARQYFQLPDAVHVYIQDARHHLATTTSAYDFLLVDVFNGDTTPHHLVSQEAFQLMAKRMTPQGVLAINLIGGVDGRDRGINAILKTLETVFESIVLYPLFDTNKEESGNMVVIAHKGPPRSPATLNIDPIHPMARDLVVHSLTHPTSLPRPAMNEARLLTDNDNPVDLLGLAVKESVRQSILQHPSVARPGYGPS
ncbi:MAG: fused MFS/spermidine synthase [Magnetococcales bacterium]|nr:fused MFS/spermidine synthase [Magnetococcales bacterium]